MASNLRDLKVMPVQNQVQLTPIQQQSLMYDVGYPGVNLPQQAQAYNANPTAPQWLGVDPSIFGYPPDNTVRPMPQMQPLPYMQMQPLPYMQMQTMPPMNQGYQFSPQGNYTGGGNDPGLFTQTQLGPMWNPGYLSNNPQF
jgi:hypothetical protein